MVDELKVAQTTAALWVVLKESTREEMSAHVLKENFLQVRLESADDELLRRLEQQIN